MISYVKHFNDFINAKLAIYEDTFTKEDMVSWVQSRENRSANNIIEHLLKRTTNYDLRDDNEPPSRPGKDDIFFMIEPNLFRRYNPMIDPPPFHLSIDGKKIALPQKAEYKKVREQRNAQEGQFRFEEELQIYLSENPQSLEDGLTLYKLGIEFRTSVGLIDLLCQDKKKAFAVLELKVAGTSDQAIGQLLRYRGWVIENLAKNNQRVRGIIIARNISEKLRLSALRVADVELFEYKITFENDKQKVTFSKKN